MLPPALLPAQPLVAPLAHKLPTCPSALPTRRQDLHGLMQVFFGADGRRTLSLQVGRGGGGGWLAGWLAKSVCGALAVSRRGGGRPPSRGFSIPASCRRKPRRPTAAACFPPFPSLPPPPQAFRKFIVDLRDELVRLEFAYYDWQKQVGAAGGRRRQQGEVRWDQGGPAGPQRAPVAQPWVRSAALPHAHPLLAPPTTRPPPNEPPPAGQHQRRRLCAVDHLLRPAEARGPVPGQGGGAGVKYEFQSDGTEELMGGEIENAALGCWMGGVRGESCPAAGALRR